MGRVATAALLAMLSGCALAIDFDAYSRNGDAGSARDGGVASAPDAGADGAATVTGSPPRVVQSAIAHGSNGTVPVTVTPTSAGNLLVVVIGNQDPQTASVTSVGDDANDAFVSANAVSTDDTGDNSNEVWYVKASSGVTSLTIRSASAVKLNVWVLELTGVTDYDTSAIANDGAASTLATAPSVTPSVARAIVISTGSSAQDLDRLTTGCPFTALPTLDGESTAWLVTSERGSYGASWVADKGTWNATTVAFR